jgi:Secretion system C-terminal sorting domain
MKKTVFLLIILVGFLKVHSQTFNVELRTNPSNLKELEVVLTPSGLTPSVVIEQIVFSIQWSSSCGVSLGALTVPTSAFSGLAKSGAEMTNAGTVSQIFMKDATSTLTSLSPSYIVARIPIIGSSGTCTFSIPPSYNAPLGDWFMFGSNNGNVIPEMQGTITNNANNVVLPTELLTFKGSRKGKVSHLQWEATNEKNLVSYIVERSADGKNFHPLGFNKPKSFNATEKVAYDFIDDSPEIGINYYRLLSKGTGKDEKYSKVISLDFGLGLSGRVFPNPLDGDLSVELDIEENSGNVEVGVYDVVGKQVLSKKMQNSDRRINFVMPTTDLPPGAYIIKVKVGNTLWERKLTKM